MGVVMAATTLKAGQRLMLCQTKRARTARHWIDEAAVLAQIERLGLVEPVRIRKVANGGYSAWAGRKWGTHCWGWWVTQNGGLVTHEDGHVVRGHDITVKAHIGGDEASRTIHHELEHAAQEERWMRLGKAKLVQGGFTTEYLRDRDTYERSATEAETRHNEHPLATDWRMT